MSARVTSMNSTKPLYVQSLRTTIPEEKLRDAIQQRKSQRCDETYNRVLKNIRLTKVINAMVRLKYIPTK